MGGRLAEAAARARTTRDSALRNVRRRAFRIAGLRRSERLAAGPSVSSSLGDGPDRRALAFGDGRAGRVIEALGARSQFVGAWPAAGGGIADPSGARRPSCTCGYWAARIAELRRRSGSIRICRVLEPLSVVNRRRAAEYVGDPSRDDQGSSVLRCDASGASPSRHGMSSQTILVRETFRTSVTRRCARCVHSRDSPR